MVSLFDDGKGGSESRPFIVYKIQSEDEESMNIFESFYRLLCIKDTIYRL